MNVVSSVQDNEVSGVFITAMKLMVFKIIHGGSRVCYRMSVINRIAIN